MPRMRITSTTGYMDDLRGLVRLPAGTVLEVEDADQAKRWTRHGVAAETDLPVGHVSDAEAGMSPDQIDAEIARLESLKNRRAARPGDGALDQRQPADQQQEQPAGLPADDEHPLARYGLAEAQRTALWRAGFTSPERIDAATDAELLETDGVGEGTLARLRAARR
jgi:hypothetical protein